MEKDSGSLVPSGADVTSFDLPHLKGKALPTYQQIKDTFKKEALPKQNRFSLSELVGNQLSVEQEEQRRFEEKVRKAVDEQVSVIRSEAHNEAFQKGLEEGRKQAYDEEKARIAQQLEGLQGAQKALTEAKALLAEQYETMLLNIVFKVAKVVVHKELEMNPGLIQATLTNILQRIAKEDDVRIRISSREFEAIEEIKQEVDKLGREGRITFEMDAAIKPGECVVESLSGEIASHIDEQIEILKIEVERARVQNFEGTGS